MFVTIINTACVSEFGTCCGPDLRPYRPEALVSPLTDLRPATGAHSHVLVLARGPHCEGCNLVHRHPDSLPRHVGVCVPRARVLSQRMSGHKKTSGGVAC